MRNNNSAGFRMQRFKDDKLGVLVESTRVFAWSSGIFTQSS
jgi:hypothetical protein